MSYTWAGNSASGNAYRLRPVDFLGGGVPNFVAANAGPAPRLDVGGSLEGWSMNLLELLQHLRHQRLRHRRRRRRGDRLPRGGRSRRVRPAEEDPSPQSSARGDVIGIGEIENDGYGPTSAIQFLVDRLNEATAPGTYAFVADAGTGQMNALGTDAIKVGFLYKPAKVTAIGATAALKFVAFVNGGDSGPQPACARPGVPGERDRRAGRRQCQPPQEQGQRMRRPGRRRRPGQLCERPHERSELPPDWLASDPTGTGTRSVLIVGDLNSYAKENLIAALEAKAYRTRRGQDRAEAYSYLDGQWGYLDHALGNAAIVPDVTGVAEWQANATSRACSTTTTTSSRRVSSRRSTRRTSSASPTTTWSSSA